MNHSGNRPIVKSGEWIQSLKMREMGESPSVLRKAFTPLAQAGSTTSRSPSHQIMFLAGSGSQCGMPDSTTPGGSTFCCRRYPTRPELLARVHPRLNHVRFGCVVEGIVGLDGLQPFCLETQHILYQHLIRIKGSLPLLEVIPARSNIPVYRHFLVE